jgi:hypothetical protein
VTSLPAAPLTRAWFLNLDADRELAAAQSYATPQTLLAQIERQQGLLSSLVQGEAVLSLTNTESASALADVAVPWCPTPTALARLRAKGWRTPAAPELAVLRAVNHRRFALKAEASSFERVWVAADDNVWLNALQRGAPRESISSFDVWRGWRLKRAYGFAGKGQRVIRGVPSTADLRWLREAMPAGFLREPELDIVEEWSLHGYIDAAGLLLGQPCRQWCDAYGQVQRFEVPAQPFAHEDTLRSAAARLATRLEAAGYFGPFGVDAFTYRTDDGIRFNAVSELNARFSLAWSLGMGQHRETALERLCSYR